MNRHVNAIAGRLSLRKPQREALEILDRVTEIAPPGKDVDLQAALEVIRSEYPTVTDFERDFPSLCFALATGVGKTRLMGAFIAYLHLAHGIRNFFVLAPGLTIYNKLITDFTPNTPKYVFKGISEFAINPPDLITGENYEQRGTELFDELARVRVNIFNIGKINSEVRGGKAPKIKRLSEYIGDSYFNYLSSLPDLVLLMDESHRYRASAGIRAINELKPVLGLELTATPLVESGKGPVYFKNVIQQYMLSAAMADGFVKEPAVATQENFNPKQFSAEQLERIKLEDGIRLHETTKVELEIYGRETDQRVVKPFMLIIARDTTHAGQLLKLIQSEEFFEGRYKDKVLQVDSSQTGEEEQQMIEKLLKVESPDEPTEIVIHVNMLKEGWDVTNLYTIVPLRAANARVLIEQSIGRGLRLPYGKRTGNEKVDTLSIVAHDNFQAIVDEAKKEGSVIQLKEVKLPSSDAAERMTAVVAQSNVDAMVAPVAPAAPGQPQVQPVAPTPFKNEVERRVAEATLKVLRKRTAQAGSKTLLTKEEQKSIVEEVKESLAPKQLEIEGLEFKPNIAELVMTTTQLMVDQTIDIPRIVLVPKGEVSTGFNAFQLDLSSVHYQPVDRDLILQKLRTGERQTISMGSHGQHEERLEDYVVRELMNFNDVSYDEHSDLLYDLAGQVVTHLKSYLKEEKDVENVLIYFQRQLAELIHTQMLDHQWEKNSGFEAQVTMGFQKLKEPAFAAAYGVAPMDFKLPVEKKSEIGKYLFAGFQRCLYGLQRFHSDTERKLAVIADRDGLKWFRPAAGQFQIYYKLNHHEHDYQPDFVVEGKEAIYMVETKATKDIATEEVQKKKEAGVDWCKHASAHTSKHGGKPWKYLLIPHDNVDENMSLEGLAKQYHVKG